MAVATALILCNGNCVLVSRKENHSDFGLPGGKLEDGETFYDAFVREIFEETGLRVSTYESIYTDFYRGNDVFTFLVHVPTQLPLSTSESAVVRWGPTSELLAGSFADYNERMLRYFKC